MASGLGVLSLSLGLLVSGGNQLPVMRQPGAKAACVHELGRSPRAATALADTPVAVCQTARASQFG